MVEDINYSQHIGNLISFGAFILAIYATVRTRSLDKVQIELSQRLLDKEDRKLVEAKQAKLSASFIKLGNSKFKFKIWNSGEANARNVRIDFPDGNDMFIQTEINRKFPLELLEMDQSVELIAAATFGTESKYAVKVLWADDYSLENEKILYPTI